MIDFTKINVGDKIQILFVDNEVMNARIVSTDDEEESGLGEDGISVITEDGRYIGIGNSEVDSITFIE